MGDHHEQRVRKVREARLLPLLHRAEEVGVLRQTHDPQVPVLELTAQPFGQLLGRRPLRHLAQSHAAGRQIEGRVQQSRQRLARQRLVGLSLLGDAVEVGDDVVVHRVEQQQILALGDEVAPQVVGDQHVQHGHVAERHRRRLGARLRHVFTEPVQQHRAVDRDLGGACRQRSPRARTKLSIVEGRGQGPARERQIELVSKLVRQVDLGLLFHPGLAQQLLALVAEAAAQAGQQLHVVRQGQRQLTGIDEVLDPQDLADVLVMLEEIPQSPQIAHGVRFPAVVEEHADGGDQRGTGVLVVLLRLTEDELGDAAALVVHGLLLFVVVLPCP